MCLPVAWLMRAQSTIANTALATLSVDGPRIPSRILVDPHAHPALTKALSQFLDRYSRRTDDLDLGFEGREIGQTVVNRHSTRIVVQRVLGLRKGPAHRKVRKVPERSARSLIVKRQERRSLTTPSKDTNEVGCRHSFASDQLAI